ncbi:MAG: protein YgfX [Oceanospirillaceae bacterium]
MPSRSKRRLYIAIHLLSVMCIIATRLTADWQLFFISLIVFSALYEYKYKQPRVALHWDLISRKVNVAINAGPLQQTLGVVKVHLIFGVLLLQIKRAAKSDLKLLIFKDSVDENSYRRLRVAARWASLKEE